MPGPPLLFDRYRPIRLLGEGGAGRVWLVEDRERPGTALALKQLGEPDRVRSTSLIREFGTLTCLRHPNLVEVHDLHVDDSGLAGFTLEYVGGRDIVAAVRAAGPQLACELAAESLRALAFLHDFGLVHRDLKPANVLVRDRPRLGCRLVVLDFGLAMRGGDNADDAPQNAGTLTYLAPELLDGAPASPRSDLYSLGALLFETVHGRPPFVPDPADLGAFLDAVRSGRRSRPPAPSGYPAGLAGWLEELLSPDPAQRPAGATEALARLNAATGARHLADTTVGRAARLASGPPAARLREIQELWGYLDRARPPRVVWLCGPPGSGKQRIVRWLAGDAIRRGWRILAPNAALVGAGAGRLRAWLRQRLTGLRGRALVLVSAERAAELPTALLERSDHAPVCAVAAVDPAGTRNPALGRVLRLAGASRAQHRIDLDPLNADSARALIQRATGRTQVSPARVEWLLRESHGDLQLADELLVEGAWEQGRRAERRRPRERAVARRWQDLSTAARGLLESLATLRAEVPAEVATAVAELDLAQAEAALSELRVLGLARNHDGLWSIESPRTAERVSGGLTARRHRTLHRRAAERWSSWLDDHGGDRFDLARLWSAAGDVERAVATGEGAADQALARDDPAAAAERLAFVLRHLSRRDPRRLRLRLEHAAALRSANLTSAAARAYGAALRCTRDVGQRAEVLAGQAAMLVQSGRFARGQAVARRALDLAADLPLPRARAQEALGIVLARQGESSRALPYLRQAVAAFEAAQDEDAMAHALQALALCEANDGRPEAREHLTRAIELLQRAGARGQGLITRVALAVLEQRAGRLERARHMLGEVRAVAAKHSNLLVEGLAACTQAQNSVFLGYLDEAVMLSQESEDTALHLGDDRLLFASRSARAQALLRCGRAVEAVTLLQPLLESSPTNVDPVMIEYVRLALTEARLASPGCDAATLEAEMHECLARLRRLNDPDSCLWGLCLELQRRAVAPGAGPDPVRQELERLLARGGSWDQPYYRAVGLVAWAACRAAQGEWTAAERAARTALELSNALDLPGLSAEAAARLAPALDALRRPADAETRREQGCRALDRAAERILDRELRRGFTESPRFAALYRPELAQSTGERLLALYEIIRRLNSQHDPDRLLESMLDMALEVVGAERGLILLGEAHGRPTVRLARNLEQQTIADAEVFSRRVVAQAASGRPVLAIDDDDERIADLQSVSLYGIRSLMCVPLRSRGSIIGAVYVDDRRQGTLFDNDDLRFLEAFADHAALALQNARAVRRLSAENLHLQAAAEARVQFGNLVGESPTMREVFALIEKTSRSDLPVLIQGESGTGKELVARAVHFNGPRRKSAFVIENCAAVPDTLLQSELFGHVRGAFTGASRTRPGLFEQADGGTLFLDEIGDMSASMQVQLLRVIESGEIRRVGDERQFGVDVRVVAATHRDLTQRVQEGLFREDLLYRLQVLVIHVPPLRKRAGDLALLTRFFLDRISRRRQQPPPEIDPRVAELFERYPWPGNVRQLENVLERLTLLSCGRPIDVELLERDRTLPAVSAAAAAEPMRLQFSERERVGEALRAAGGNRSRAARLLGISRATIYRKIKEYGL